MGATKITQYVSFPLINSHVSCTRVAHNYGVLQRFSEFLHLQCLERKYLSRDILVSIEAGQHHASTIIAESGKFFTSSFQCKHKKNYSLLHC